MTWQEVKAHIEENEQAGGWKFFALMERDIIQAFADELVKRLNEDASNTVRMTINEMLTEIGVER